MKVYLLQVSRGCYDDYSCHIEAVYSNLECAEKARIEFDNTHIVDESKLPMSEDDWSRLDYGYDSDSNDAVIVPKEGYSVEDFKEMNRLMDLIWEDYNLSRIIEKEVID